MFTGYAITCVACVLDKMTLPENDYLPSNLKYSKKSESSKSTNSEWFSFSEFRPNNFCYTAYYNLK